MDNPNHDPVLRYIKRPFAGLIAGVALLTAGCAPSGNVEGVPAPTETAATSPTPSPSETPESPESTKPVDLLRDNLEGMTSQEIYPLPEHLTPDYVVAHRDKIPELFAIDEETASDPKSFIKAMFDRINARFVLGTDAETTARILDGDGTVNSDRLDDFIEAWRATYNHPVDARPKKGVVGFFQTAFYAHQATALAEYTDIPTQPVSVALIPDMDSFEYTIHKNGTWSGTISYREWLWADNNATKQSIGKTFPSKNSIITWKFDACGVNKDTGSVNLACEGPADK